MCITQTPPLEPQPTSLGLGRRLGFALGRGLGLLGRLLGALLRRLRHRELDVKPKELGSMRQLGGTQGGSKEVPIMSGCDGSDECTMRRSFHCHVWYPNCHS